MDEWTMGAIQKRARLSLYSVAVVQSCLMNGLSSGSSYTWVILMERWVCYTQTSLFKEM